MASSISHGYNEPGTRNKDVPWHAAELDHIEDSTRELLEAYSKIPPERVIPHIVEIRDQAWEVYPYPCVGNFHFAQLAISKAPQYQEVLQRVKDGEKMLDLGCCFGQDIRRLVFDGAPSTNLIGSDLKQEFWDLGYSLFRDKATLQSRFLAGDIFSATSPLSTLDGTISIIHASSFFHLFSRTQQVHIAKRVVALLSPVPGSFIFGRHVGNLHPGAQVDKALDRSGDKFRHNEETWRKMWEEVGEATGTRWAVEVTLSGLEEWGREGRGPGRKWIHDENVKLMRYCCRRL